MSESLTPDQIARLDPYNRLGFTTKKHAEELLGAVPEVEEPPMAPEIPYSEKLIKNEHEKWKRVLGSDVVIHKTPPDFITPDFVKNLHDAFGLSVFYMPDVFWGNGLNITTLNTHSHAKYFLEEMKSNFPNWRPLEELTPNELVVTTNPRNLKLEFWQNVKKGKIDFPTLPGKWMVAETRNEVHSNNPPQFPLNGLLGISERHRMAYWDIEKVVVQNRLRISNVLGLATEIPFRLPEAIEANLIFNRFGLRCSSYSEDWTSTKVRGILSGEKYLRIGKFAAGWAGSVNSVKPDKRDYGDSFRLVAELE